MTPTRRLEREHQTILLLLTVLERLARQALAGERPVTALEEAIELLRVFADQGHHRKEEGHLFPALNAAGLPQHGGHVALMLLEHDVGRRELDAIAEASLALALGHDAADRLARAVGRYVDRLRDHIQLEDEVLFPLARELLPGAGDALTGDYADVDLATFGPGGYARVLARIDALAAATLGVTAAR